MKYLQFIFSGFWHFVGTAILISIILDFIFRCWNRTFRHMNIRKHGYPPAHCDADGDFRQINKDCNETEERQPAEEESRS